MKSPGHIGAKNEMIATVWLLERGYQVFRNVSPNGPVDIIAMKDGKTLLFDVKTTVQYNGTASSPRISKEQKDLGVACINVSGSDCVIDWNPTVAGAKLEKTCPRCKKIFMTQMKANKVFCGDICRQRQFRDDNPDWRTGVKRPRITQ